MEVAEETTIATRRESSRAQFSIRSILIATLVVAAFCGVGQVVWQSYLGPIVSLWLNPPPRTLPPPYYLYDDVHYVPETSATNNGTQRGDEPLASSEVEGATGK